jgi:sulfur-carrier protein
MATVLFTQHLRRHVHCPSVVINGDTVRHVLNNVFTDNPHLRGYILDDQGILRKHITIFIDGTMIADRDQLSDRVERDSEVYVLQALSGG